MHLLALVLLLAAWFLGGRAALAHAVLLEASPADGAVLATAPSALSLRFNEPVTPVELQVLDPGGRPVATMQNVTVRDGELGIALPAALPNGTYIASYRVISLDSHPVAGSLVFSIGAPSAAARGTATAMAPGDPVRQGVTVIVRALFCGALMMAAGGVLFLVLVGGPGTELGEATRRALCWQLQVAAGVACVAALLGIGLEGLMAEELPARALLSARPWQLGAATTLGPSTAMAVAALLPMAIALGCLPSRAAAAIAGLAALVAVGSLALTGHAAAAPPRWLAASGVALHAVMVAFWLGSLWPLLLALRDGGLRVAPLLQRFSRRAVPAVAVLLAAGLLIATIQIGGLAGLVPTRYGVMLLLKLALVGALLLLALDNKRRLTPALAAGDGAAVGRLRRSIRWEIGLAATILLLTEALGTTPPPRALAEQAAAAEGVKIEAAAHGYHAAIAIRPTRAGHNELTLRVTGPDGQPFAAQAATLVLSAPTAGIAPLRRPLTAPAPGEYSWSGHELALPGHWTLQIELLVSDFEKVVLETAVDIK